MKPPGDLNSYDEMEEEVTSNLEVDSEELESIMGRVFIEMSTTEEINTDVEGYIDILISQAYREAARRDEKREEYNTRKKINELREEKGGILKNEYPNADPDKWKARCEARFCKFDAYYTDNKVDEVICPECGRELQIDPV